MSLGGGAKPPAKPSAVPTERIIEDIDQSGRLEAERIRKMRGRFSTFLTKGIMDPGSDAGTNKLGT